MNKFRVNLHPAFFDVPRLNEGVRNPEDSEERAVIERTQEELQRVQDAVVDPRRNNEALASWVEKADQATDKELAKQLKQLAKNKKIDFPWTDNEWKCSRAEKKLATSSAKVFQQLLEKWKLQDMINRCKSQQWDLTKEVAEQWGKDFWINSKAKDILNFYKAFKEYQNPQSEYQHLKNLMGFFCENDFENIGGVREALVTRSKKISKSDIDRWSRVLYQEGWVMDESWNRRYVIIDNSTGEEIDSKPKDWRKRASFEIIKNRLKEGEISTDKMLTLLWDFNLDGEVNSWDVGYKTWSQFIDVFRRTVATKNLEDSTFDANKAVENLVKYANKFGLDIGNVKSVKQLYEWMTVDKKWYENTITLQNFLKNLSIELWDVLENWENAWQQSLDRMVSTIWLEKKEEEVAKKAAEEKAKEIVLAWEARLKEVIKDDRERANITQQLLTQLPAMLVDKAMWEKNNWLGVGYGMPLDQIIKWMSAGFNVWIGTDWKPKFWLFVWWDRKFDLSKTTDLRTAVSAGTKLLFVPCMATSIELGQDVNKWSRDNSLDAKGEHRIVLWWNVTAVPWIFSYGFSAGYENDKQRGIEKQAENINKVMKNQAKGRIESLKGAEKKEDALRKALRAEFPKTSDEELNAATRNLLSIIQQFKIDEKTTAQDVDIYAQIVADVYSEQWRNEKLSWIADNKRKISGWKVWIQFIAWCVPVLTLVARFTNNRDARTNETEHSRIARIDAQVNGMGNGKDILGNSKEVWADKVDQINKVLERYGAKWFLVYIEWTDWKPGRIKVPASLFDVIWINIRVSNTLEWCVKKESDGYSFPANATYRLLQETGGNQRSLTLNIGSDKNEQTDITNLQWLAKLEGSNELMWGKKLEYESEYHGAWKVEYNPEFLSEMLWELETWLREIDATDRRKFSEFMRTKRDALANFQKIVNNLVDVLSNSRFNNKYKTLVDWLNKKAEEGVSDEDKQVMIDRIVSISAYDARVHMDKQKLNNVISSRGNAYKELVGPNAQAIFKYLNEEDYRGAVVNKLTKFTSEPNYNILWATAFYNRRIGDARWLWITWLWATSVLWWVTEELKGGDRELAKNWFLWWEWVLNSEKSPMEWKNLNKWVSSYIENKIWKFKTDAWECILTNDNLKNILNWWEIEIALDNSQKMVKVKLDVKYVFYLMWECANESVGMELGTLQVKEQQEVDDYRKWELYLNNGDGSNSVNVSNDQLSVGISIGWWKKKKKEDKPSTKPGEEEEPINDAHTTPTEEEEEIPTGDWTTNPHAEDNGEVGEGSGNPTEGWEWQGWQQWGGRPWWDGWPTVWGHWDSWSQESGRD